MLHLLLCSFAFSVNSELIRGNATDFGLVQVRATLGGRAAPVRKRDEGETRHQTHFLTGAALLRKFEPYTDFHFPRKATLANFRSFHQTTIALSPEDGGEGTKPRPDQSRDQRQFDYVHNLNRSFP